MDIVGLERIPSDFDFVDPKPDDDGDEEDCETTDAPAVEQSRLWVFQCKREKRIGPTQVEHILSQFFVGKAEVPYGYVLAAACDFSSRHRRRSEKRSPSVV